MKDPLSSLVALVGVVVIGLCDGALAQGPDQLAIESSTTDGASVTIEWSGGAPPYQVQSSESLPGVWVPATGTMNQLSRRVDVGDDVMRRFYRVVSGDAVIAHRLVSPVPGTTISPDSTGGLRDTDITFTWEVDDVAPDYWWFQVGTAANRTAYYTTSGEALPSSRRSQEVSGIPFDGGEIVVSLWSYSNANTTWVGSSFTYNTEALGEIETPAPGGALLSSGEFQFRANGLPVATWWVSIGSSLGANNDFNSGDNVLTANRDFLFPYEGVSLNTNGYFVRLFWRLDGQTTFQSRDYRYDAPSGPGGGGGPQ